MYTEAHENREGDREREGGLRTARIGDFGRGWFGLGGTGRMGWGGCERGDSTPRRVRSAGDTRGSEAVWLSMGLWH